MTRFKSIAALALAVTLSIPAFADTARQDKKFVENSGIGSLAEGAHGQLRMIVERVRIEAWWVTGR